MKVLVDTSVWSLALRRKKQVSHSEVEELRNLISDHRVQIMGPIRQELLSGVKEKKQCDQLAKHLEAFPDLQISTEDYISAAQFYNLCRAKGIQGSNTDFLICAVAVRKQLAIFTTDKDFVQFEKYLPIILHKL